MTIPFDPASGLLDLDRLRDAVSDETACVYIEVPGIPRHHRDTGSGDRCARTRGGRALRRRRRSDLARGPRGSAPLRRRHRLRRAPAARNPHALRRRARGFRRLARRGTFRLRVPHVPDRSRPHDRRRGVRVRGGRLGTHLVRPARRLEGVHRNDPVPLGDCGRRLPRSPRPAGPRRAGPGDHGARTVRGAAARRAARSSGAGSRRALLQGVRGRLR